MPRKPLPGFTLAELLIALAILGVIATFTIPKVLQSQTNSSHKAIAKEAAATVSSAFQAYKYAGSLSSASRARDLTPYLQYVSLTTTGNIVDSSPDSIAIACAAINPCLRLHNGAALQLFAQSFSGTASTNAIEFRLDPDGKYEGDTANRIGISVQFEIYYDGFLTTRGQARANSCNSNVCGYNAQSSLDPDWFNWN